MIGKMVFWGGDKCINAAHTLILLLHSLQFAHFKRLRDMSRDIPRNLEGEGHHRLVGMGGACMTNLFGGDTVYTNKVEAGVVEIYYTLFVWFTLRPD
jgi:hypothetical protein